MIQFCRFAERSQAAEYSWMARSIHAAERRSLESEICAPMSWTPIGRLYGPLKPGNVIAGTCNTVQNRWNNKIARREQPFRRFTSGSRR